MEELVLLQQQTAEIASLNKQLHIALIEHIKDLRHHNSILECQFTNCCRKFDNDKNNSNYCGLENMIPHKPPPPPAKWLKKLEFDESLKIVRGNPTVKVIKGIKRLGSEYVKTTFQEASPVNLTKNLQQNTAAERGKVPEIIGIKRLGLIKSQSESTNTYALDAAMETEKKTQVLTSVDNKKESSELKTGSLAESKQQEQKVLKIEEKNENEKDMAKGRKSFIPKPVKITEGVMKSHRLKLLHQQICISNRPEKSTIFRGQLKNKRFGLLTTRVIDPG